MVSRVFNCAWRNGPMKLFSKQGKFPEFFWTDWSTFPHGYAPSLDPKPLPANRNCQQFLFRCARKAGTIALRCPRPALPGLKERGGMDCAARGSSGEGTAFYAPLAPLSRRGRRSAPSLPTDLEFPLKFLFQESSAGIVARLNMSFGGHTRPRRVHRALKTDAAALPFALFAGP